jgi:hypothetical protein
MFDSVDVEPSGTVDRRRLNRRSASESAKDDSLRGAGNGYHKVHSFRIWLLDQLKSTFSNGTGRLNLYLKAPENP